MNNSKDKETTDTDTAYDPDFFGSGSFSFSIRNKKLDEARVIFQLLKLMTHAN